jgi:uncharacterized lipoprotein YmbA
LLYLDQDLHVEFFSLPPIEQIPRGSVLSREVPHADVLQEAQLADALAVKAVEMKQSKAKLLRLKASKFAKSRDTLIQLAVSSPLGRSRSVLVPVLQRSMGILPPLAPRRLTVPLEQQSGDNETDQVSLSSDDVQI